LGAGVSAAGPGTRRGEQKNTKRGEKVEREQGRGKEAVDGEKGKDLGYPLFDVPRVDPYVYTCK